ncbi:MAG TPA: MYXO-CTERM sorting domain-containing protein, partial [Polyangiales bacterium]
PRSIKPVEAGRACPYDKDDQCGESDYCNNETVLWDNLNPHSQLAGIAASYTWTVKLPNVECDNCTLQVIQVMEDTVHGAYCPIDTCSAHEASLEDIYHRCINLKLVKGAKNSAGTTTGPVNNGAGAMECAKSVVPPFEPPVTSTDAGPMSTVDAGVDNDEGDASVSKPDEDDGATGSKIDAGKSDTGKKDAGKSDSGKKDAGKKDAGSKSDDVEEEEPQAAASDDGCALASSNAEGAAWSLLALGLVLARRRRRRAA